MATLRLLRARIGPGSSGSCLLALGLASQAGTLLPGKACGEAVEQARSRARLRAVDRLSPLDPWIRCLALSMLPAADLGEASPLPADLADDSAACVAALRAGGRRPQRSSRRPPLSYDDMTRDVSALLPASAVHVPTPLVKRGCAPLEAIAGPQRSRMGRRSDEIP